MNRILTIAALLTISACSKQDEAPAPAPANEVAGAPAADANVDTRSEVPLLEGAWAVSAIDGAPISAGSAMAASFGGGAATIASGCLRRGWTYTQKRNVVSFSNDPSSSANCGGGPSGEQESAYIALEKASIVIFGKDGKEASLSGTGGNLTLRRR